MKSTTPTVRGFAVPTEHRLQRNGRTIAWTQWGDPAGRAVLRCPGTPSCRVHLPTDLSAWADRNVFCITTERPGLGESTRLSGRRFREHADDLAAILDVLGIQRAYLAGISGGAPHVLALSAAHPDRVAAAAIVSGSAPLNDQDEAGLIEVNAQSRRLARAGDGPALQQMYVTMRNAILADPRGALRGIVKDAAPEDIEIMERSNWIDAMAHAMAEALKRGAEGWMDEGIALALPWDFDSTTITTKITWWHSAADRNVPLTAARRLVAQLSHAKLNVLQGGHIALGRDGAILDQLFAD